MFLGKYSFAEKTFLMGYVMHLLGHTTCAFNSDMLLNYLPHSMEFACVGRKTVYLPIYLYKICSTPFLRWVFILNLAIIFTVMPSLPSPMADCPIWKFFLGFHSNMWNGICLLPTDPIVAYEDIVILLKRKILKLWKEIKAQISTSARRRRIFLSKIN